MKQGLVAVGLGIAVATAGCASAPAVAPAPVVTDQQKMSWILQLEDQRILKVIPPPAPAPAPVKSKRAAPAPPPPPAPDLTHLLTDPSPRIRRRAALAIGRAGLADGVALLQTALADADPDVRRMAAFGLGLLGDGAATPALVTALQDPDSLVRGRAAEALGLIGDPSPATAVGQMVSAYIKGGAIASIAPDDETWPGPPEAAAVRLGLFALVRLKGWDALSSAVLDGSGNAVSAWWPMAYALQRIGDPRAAHPLEQLAQGQGLYTRAFAIRGLGALKDAAATPILVPLLDPAQRSPMLAIAAARALAQIGASDAAGPLTTLLTAPDVDPNVRLEAVAALGALRAHESLPSVQDMLTDGWPSLRAAALRAAAAIDQDAFVLVLSGLDPDRHWSVRAALAGALASYPPDIAIERLRPMLDDQDKRVVPAVIDALTRLKAPDLDAVLLNALKNPDVAIRVAAARSVGELKPAGGPAALADAYRAGLGDGDYSARAAALTALAQFGAADAAETLKTALADKDWAVRLAAARLSDKVEGAGGTRALAIRPAPGTPIVPYETPDLIAPSYSPHAFLETAKGTIEIELAVLDAPQTTQSFMALARKGFFNGLQFHRVVPNFVIQDGDPRGDGEGGPGYTIRDELNDLPYVRGTVGMALAGPDTGGSQFFITHSPQPHLDAKYTVFGRVVSGMDVVDRVQQWDVIQRVRIWDGKTMQ